MAWADMMVTYQAKSIEKACVTKGFNCFNSFGDDIPGMEGLGTGKIFCYLVIYFVLI